MKVFLSILFSYFVVPALSQSNIKLFAQKEDGKTILYLQNHEFSSVSLFLELSLSNMTAVESPDHIYIIPPNTEKYKLAELSRIKRGRNSYAYTYKVVYGDITQLVYDHNYIYDLPYAKGRAFSIVQGYNGKFTHQNENALDFDMPEGTEIHAARGGRVIAVVQHFYESCLLEECKKKANYVLISHADGTIADYSHIQYNGAKVAVGDSVNKGQLIAISGNTGYTRGPHLHFICFLPGFEKRRGLQVKFKTGKGALATYLSEHKTYRKNYSSVR